MTENKFKQLDFDNLSFLFKLNDKLIYPDSFPVHSSLLNSCNLLFTFPP